MLCMFMKMVEIMDEQTTGNNADFRDYFRNTSAQLKEIIAYKRLYP